MRDIDFGEQRQLPEMPRLKRWRLERLIGSGKIANREKAITGLVKMEACKEVPGLMRRALLDRADFREWETISFNGVMTGIKTLWEFSDKFGAGNELSYQETVDALEHLDPYAQIEGWVWRHWQEVGVWGVNVFMGLFGRMADSVVRDRLQPWFERIATEIPKDKREWMAKNLVDLLLSTEQYRFSTVFADYNPYVGQAAQLLVSLSEEAVPLILGRIGGLESGDKKPSGFWPATRTLIEIKDLRSTDFLVERLFDVQHSEEAEGIRKRAADALIEMSGEFDPEVVVRLAKACGNVTIDSESVDAVWRVFRAIDDGALVRARRQMEELIRLEAPITGHEMFRIKGAAARALSKVRENDVLVNEVVDTLGGELLKEINLGIVRVLGASRNLRAKKYLEEALIKERKRGLAEGDLVEVEDPHIEDVESLFRRLGLDHIADSARRPVKRLKDAIEQLDEDLEAK